LLRQKHGGESKRAAVIAEEQLRLNHSHWADSNGDSNSSNQRQAAATGGSV
jgi:hypothetical protein